jgi:3-isopropylmalate/(R)-2-methylmalate dehydratase small subunit
MIRSKIWRFGDNVDTDQIIASQYLLVDDPRLMLDHVFESLRPEFTRNARPGQIIVAGKNFGCGSSREQAAMVLKMRGVDVIIARSFGRIFFRNCINIGLPVVILENLPDHVRDGDEAAVDLERGRVELGRERYDFPEFPPHLMNIIKSGGLLAYINEKRGDGE